MIDNTISTLACLLPYGVVSGGVTGTALVHDPIEAGSIELTDVREPREQRHLETSLVETKCSMFSKLRPVRPLAPAIM